MSETIFAIIPWVVDWPSTRQAILDVLKQDGISTRVLLIGNGLSGVDRATCESDWLSRESSVLTWYHDPSLPSLAATWNAGLRFAWESGAARAWVLNNDLRVGPGTLAELARVMDEHPDRPFFVSAVNDPRRYEAGDIEYPIGSRGGPDFSCFLISKEGHEKYPFCEGHVPAYGEDVCQHRRVMLGGDGDRMFSIPYPYSHAGSGTLNSLSPERRAALEHQIENVSRAYFRSEWGGGCNAETFDAPFSDVPKTGVTTVELFDQIRQSW